VCVGALPGPMSTRCVRELHTLARVCRWPSGTDEYSFLLLLPRCMPLECSASRYTHTHAHTHTHTRTHTHTHTHTHLHSQPAALAISRA